MILNLYQRIEAGATVQTTQEEDLMANSVLIPVVQKETITFGAILHQVISTKEKWSSVVKQEVKPIIDNHFI